MCREIRPRISCFIKLFPYFVLDLVGEKADHDGKASFVHREARARREQGPSDRQIFDKWAHSVRGHGAKQNYVSPIDSSPDDVELSVEEPRHKGL